MGALRRRGLARWSRPLLRRTYSPLARQRLARGLRILSAGEVVITDRLHGHILSLMLGIPHVILDNSYGKLSSFHEAWTATADDVHFAASPADALRLAACMAAARRPSIAPGEPS
jgi:pyruvyl transferase EpsO